MMEWLADIAKVVLPMALLVLVVYLVLKQFFQGQARLKAMELQRDRKKDTLELRLNAYERLALYMERISFPDMIMRISSSEMEAYTLYSAIIMTIQKEYEHNLSQQIYISENLWQIIRLAKQDLANLVTEAYAEDEKQTMEQYRNRLIQMYSNWSPNPVEKAKSAVRQEAALLI